MTRKTRDQLDEEIDSQNFSSQTIPGPLRHILRYGGTVPI